MLYSFLKIVVRIAIKIFCRKIVINNSSLLKEKGPLLLAVNHPNSFLDAVIIETLFDEPVHSLARGDAFVNRFISRILSALKILPVYRTTEGVENLSENYRTFNACKTIFKKNGIVLIFSEGKCINEWHLRPLKKGTARLAFSAWEENIPLKVLPLSINYSSFRKFGKNIFIRFGRMITQDDFDFSAADGARNIQFNTLLKIELQKGVFEIQPGERKKRKELLQIHVSQLKKILLITPAFMGYLLHAPLYIPVRATVLSKTKDNDHYDSALTAILLLAYPVYLAVFCFIVFAITGSILSFSLILFLPFCAWSYVQVARQTE